MAFVGTSQTIAASILFPSGGPVNPYQGGSHLQDWQCPPKPGTPPTTDALLTELGLSPLPASHSGQSGGSKDGGRFLPKLLTPPDSVWPSERSRRWTEGTTWAGDPTSRLSLFSPLSLSSLRAALPQIFSLLCPLFFFSLVFYLAIEILPSRPRLGHARTLPPLSDDRTAAPAASVTILRRKSKLWTHSQSTLRRVYSGLFGLFFLYFWRKGHIFEAYRSYTSFLPASLDVGRCQMRMRIGKE